MDFQPGYDLNLITEISHSFLHYTGVGTVIDNRIHFSVHQCLRLCLKRIIFRHGNICSQLLLDICNGSLHIIRSGFELDAEIIPRRILKRLCRIISKNCNYHIIDSESPSGYCGKHVIRSGNIICTDCQNNNNKETV